MCKKDTEPKIKKKIRVYKKVVEPQIKTTLLQRMFQQCDVDSRIRKSQPMFQQGWIIALNAICGHSTLQNSQIPTISD